MSRNSSVRSSFSYKTEEDFRDEIMDLKGQLARMKEESKLLKVKLRRSEENAARKEKIICTMIDPLKAHLPLKSTKYPNKISQEKGRIIKPVSKAPSHGLCSRSYRHDISSWPMKDSNTRMISSAGPQRRILNKKGNLNVMTSMECLSPYINESSKYNPRSFNKCSQQVHNVCGCQRSINDKSDKVMRRELVKKMNRKVEEKLASHNSINFGKKKQINSIKMKQSESQEVDSYHQFDSENESQLSSPSFSNQLIEKQRKTKKGIKMEHSSSESPSNYVVCKQCKFRSLQKEFSAAPNCSRENLLERKKSMLLWNKNGPMTDKQIQTLQSCESVPKDANCCYDKFGIHLINEGNEQEGLQFVQDNNSDRLTGDDIDKLRRESIFRVDIKKKEPKEETGSFEDLEFFPENAQGTKEGEGKDNIEFVKNTADLTTQEKDEDEVGFSISDNTVRFDDNVIAMDQMMDSLSIIEQSSSCTKKLIDFLNKEGGNVKREKIEKQSLSSFDTKHLNPSEDKNNIKNIETVHTNLKCCRNNSDNGVLALSENMFHQRNSININKGSYGICENEETIILDLISQSNDAEAVVNRI